MGKFKNTLSVLGFLAGIILLGGLVREAGVGELADLFASLGAAIVWVFFLPVSWYALQALAWRLVLSDARHEASFLHVFLAKIAGEAVNTLTPLGIAGGDPYRVWLMGRKTSGPASAASVVVDRTVHTVAVFSLLVIAFSLAWVRLPLPEVWRIIFPLALAAILVLLLGLIALQRRGAIAGLTRLLSRFGLFSRRLEAWRLKIADTDARVAAFYGRHRAFFFGILFLHFLSRLIGAVEIWLIARFLEVPLSFEHALYLTALTVLINMAFAFVPAGLGVLEGGYGAMFYLLSFNPAHGVAIQLVRRVRTFFWIFLGLLVIFVYKPRRLASAAE